jgi:hypothetical protein
LDAVPGRRQIYLADQANSWSTPNAHDSTGRRSENASMADHHYSPHDLVTEAELWRTPDAPKAGGARTHTTSAGDGHQFTIADQAEMWHTPNVPNGGRKMTLADVIAKGATEKGKRQVGLENQEMFWPARDSRDPNLMSYQERSGTSKGEQLNNFVEHHWITPHGLTYNPDSDLGGGGEFAEQAANWDLRPGLPTMPHGLEFWQRFRILRRLCRRLRQVLPSPYRKGRSIFKRKLNPDFVDWLMGWPPGWSSAGRVFSAAEMASYLSRQRMYLRSLLDG